MKLRHPRLIRLVAIVAAWIIRLWVASLRKELVLAPDGRRHPVNPRTERFLYALWHETILWPAAFRGRVHVLISQHADGELIARICKHLRLGVVRGSTTRGGARALLELHRVSRHSNLVVTPDGPRGPRRRVQPGLVFLASRTGLPIVACGFAYAHAWRARSWDRFAVPWPWSRAVGVFTTPLHVPPGLDRDGLEHYRQLAEEQLARATASAERLASSGRRPLTAGLPAEHVSKASA